MRTERYRYTEWVDFDQNDWRTIWDNQLGRELYDHLHDPQENHNLAYDEGHQAIVNYLSPKLRDGWR